MTSPPARRCLRLFLLVPVLAASAMNAGAGLLWYSPMDGSADAVVGSNGVPVGNPLPVADRNGAGGAAVGFDGLVDYYDLGQFGTFQDGSMAVWVRADTNEGERGAFCAGASAGGSAVYFSFMNDSSGRIRVDLDDGDLRRGVISGGALTAGQWYHVATTWNGSDTLRLFLDGIEIASASLWEDNAPYTMTFHGLIGGEREGARLWQGALDDAGLWDERLSSRRVAAIHGLGKFQGLGLNHPAIDTVVAFNTQGQTVTVGAVTWEYVGGLSGATGTTGGTVAGGDAFIVLDSVADLGIRTASSPVMAPGVANTAATNIAAVSATIGGVVTDTGGEDPVVAIYWGDNDGGTEAGSWDQANNLSTQSGAFADTLFNLADGVTHYYRCFASNSGGSAWATSSESFTTAAYGLAALTTSPATEVTGVSARIDGAVTGTGGDTPVVEIHFGTTDGGTDPGAWDQSVSLGLQSGGFSSVLGSLAPGTSYFFTVSGQNAAGRAWVVPARGFTTSDVSGLVINEFMASNTGGTPVPNQLPGTTDDWIEIHNRGSSTLSLAGWHLTDDPARPGQWTFPPGTSLGPGGFLVVFASGNNAPDPNGNLHTGFRLGVDGEYVALADPSLHVVSEFGPGGSDYPAQQSDVSYGPHPVTLEAVFFGVPTPGAANDAGGQLLVEDTKFSHKRGYYTAPISVSITTATAGATIRYTLDGTEPSETNGRGYTTPIPIASTTVLRARAYKEGMGGTNVDTQSYIFPDDIATQERPAGYPTAWGGEPNADYGVDTQISQAPEYAARFLEGLRDLPTLSVTGRRDDFFGVDGVYVDTQDRSREAPVSAEYFHPAPAADGVNLEEGFQIDCGLKLQGGASRSPEAAIKHSLSLRFREFYGPGKLDYPVFDGTTVESFDSIHLRAMYNNSWIHRDAGQRARATMIRDQWARDSLIAMGNPDGGQGHFVHLYLNGIYWGVYNLHERLENDHYAAYNGYDSSTVLGYNPGIPTAEESASFNAMKAVVENPASTWSEIQAVLDIDNYIDFVIVEHFGKNNDLKTNGNWRAAGGGTANAPWRFYLWDTERTLENENDTGTPGAGGDGALLFDNLEAHREFRVRFADRAYRHLFHGGALTNLENRTRFEKYAEEITTAVVCESARWGDDRPGGGFLGNYSRDENWTGAVYGTPGGPGTVPANGVLGSWFPTAGTNRTAIMISAWQTRTFAGSSDTFLGTIDAPLFTVNGSEQHGGEIPSGGTLSASTATGSIYYTTDGSDPRLEGGEVAPGAVLLTGGMVLPASGLVRMRVREGSGDSWSPLSEAVFYLERRATADDLRITEINYNGLRPDAVEAAAGANLAVPRVFSGGDFEFLEIRNTGAEAVNLDGVRFTAGLGFTFPVMSVPAGGFVVVVEDIEAFEVRYGPGVPVAGKFSGTLDNAGERIAFATWDGTVIQDFTFQDAGTWPGRADGKGSSLEIIDPGGAYGASENWRASCEFHGSPGVAGVGTDGRIVINEVFTHTDLPAKDAIELHNTTGAAIPVAGWFLSDSSGNYRKFRIPSGSIPAGGYLHWDEDDFNANQNLAIASYAGALGAPPATVTTTGHGLSTGDVVTISGYGGIGGYDGTFEVTVLDATRFTIPVPYLDDHGAKGTYTGGEPFALSATGEDVWLLEGDAGGRPRKFVDRAEFAAAFNGETLGRWPNGAGTGTLVTMVANTLGEANTGPVVGPVMLSEVMYHPAATIEDNLEFVEISNTGPFPETLEHWRLRGGVDFDFTAAHVLAPGGVLVVVGFDPAIDVSAAGAFRAHHGIDATIPLAGPWTDGPLRNDTGTIRLQRPDTPPVDDPTNHPQVTADEVIYFNSSPWPEDADGSGESLNRAGPGLFGNFATSWTGADPTPGGMWLDYDLYRDLTFGPGTPAGSGDFEDFDSDGMLNLLEYALGLNPRVPDGHQVPVITVEGGTLALVYPKNTLLVDITYEVQVSTDLVNWVPVADVPVSSVNYGEVRKASVPIDVNQRLFMRLAAAR